MMTGSTRRGIPSGSKILKKKTLFSHAKGIGTKNLTAFFEVLIKGENQTQLTGKQCFCFDTNDVASGFSVSNQWEGIDVRGRENEPIGGGYQEACKSCDLSGSLGD